MYKRQFHAHDWHAALVPYFLQQIRKTDSRFRKSRSILTIHNAGYQGRYPGYLKSWLKIDDSDFHPDCFEDFGGVNLLKGGMLSADQVNTVSPGYAEELKTPLGGHGLHPFYQRLKQDFSASLTAVIMVSGIQRLTLIFQRIIPPVTEGEKCCVKQLYWRN